MSRASERRAARLAKKQAKIDARSARKADRQAARTERATGRQGVRATAYEMGVNPNSFISDIVDTVGATAVGLKGIGNPNTMGPPMPGEVTPGGNSNQKSSGGDGPAEWLKENPIAAGGAALGAILLAKKAKLF